MARVTDGQSLRAAAIGAALTFFLGGCSTNAVTTTIFGGPVNLSSPLSGNSAGVVDQDALNNDTPCPEIKVRSGAATLVIGSKPGEGEPAPLDVRYQGSIVTAARECHLNAGLLSMKVGVEGRIITGPAGEPGTVNVPLRMAVVQEGVTPRTILSKFAIIPVTVSNAVDRVTFTHVDPDITFPLPPGNAIEAYVVYIGFDPLSAQPQKKKPVPRKPKAKGKPRPKPATKPSQS